MLDAFVIHMNKASCYNDSRETEILQYYIYISIPTLSVSVSPACKSTTLASSRSS